MDDSLDLFDDGLGPDPLDRGSLKEMAGGSSGGSFYDPSYEDALRVMERAHEIPSPFEQRPRTMDNPEAAELARRLTLLRNTAGIGSGPLGLPRTLGGDAAVEAFIAALQRSPADPTALSALRQQIEEEGTEARDTVALVCEHPAVRGKLGV